MQQRLLFAFLGTALLAGSLPAADVGARIKAVDPAKGTVTVTVNGQDRTLTVAKDVKVLDKQGKELPEGLKAKGLQGADVTLTVEKDGNQFAVKAIRLGAAQRPDVGNRSGPREGDLKVGSAAPDFTVKDVKAERTVKLSDLKGKPVVLIFGSCT